MTFDEHVRGMTSAEIIMAMVNGLRKRHVKLNMTTFGAAIGEVCCGCAVTNAICEIMGRSFAAHEICTISTRADAVNASASFLAGFEAALEMLRFGYVEAYNSRAIRLGIAEIYTDSWLPMLTTYYTEGQLERYVKLAELNKKP